MTAILARNEAAPDRYLARVLACCAAFSDATLVLDDGSTDDTVAIAEAAGALVKRRPQAAAAWGAESSARAELWERGTKLAKDGWLLICDADMILHGDPRPLAASWDAAAWAWPLVDLWDGETTFRVDGPWSVGPSTPRPWLFRPAALTVPPAWSGRGIHVGHAPANFGLAGPCALAPSDLYWLHLAYSKPEHRVRKHAQYTSVDGQLSEFERAHVATLLD